MKELSLYQRNRHESNEKTALNTNCDYHETSFLFRAISSIVWLVVTLFICWYASDIGQVVPLISSAVLHFQFTFPGTTYILICSSSVVTSCVLRHLASAV